MLFGSFTLDVVEFGLFRLDGGAMFGSVPKTLWSRSIAADEDNCIPLTCRSLLITTHDRRFLIDTGMGDKWNDKQRAIYGVRNAPLSAWGFDPASVTDLVLTHLHFDHGGGVSHFDASGTPQLTFPNARVHLQLSHWDYAQNPSVKDRASFLPENITPLKSANLVMCDGDAEIYPDLIVHRVDGHTPGQQWIELRAGKERIFFPTDLIPTSHHIPLAYHMGYDVCAMTLLREKHSFLERARKENALVVFQHDRDVVAARVGVGEKGQFVVRDGAPLLLG